MTIVLHKGKIENVKHIYFAEDGKLDIEFTDGSKSKTIIPSLIKEIIDDTVSQENI